MKFGGTALGDGERVRQAARLVAERRAERPIVVVSAVAGVTDLLDQAAKGEIDARTIRLRHRSLISQLGLEPELLNRLQAELGFVLDAVRAKQRLEPREHDVILSFGERMSARVFAGALRSASTRRRSTRSTSA
jgi:aspartate kinase